MNNENPSDPLAPRMGLSKAAALDAVTGCPNDRSGVPADYEHKAHLGIGYFAIAIRCTHARRDAGPY